MAVELIKVHYFEPSQQSRNVHVPSVSRLVAPPPKTTASGARAPILIKRNVFGPRWVLQINADVERGAGAGRRGTCTRRWYAVGVVCIVVAVVAGVVFALGPTHLLNRFIYNNREDARKLLNVTDRPFVVVVGRKYANDTPPLYEINSTCRTCNRSSHVCLNVNEEPQCVTIRDRKDPTGCGGLCRINIDFCKLLDHENALYQCLPLKDALNCSSGTFNCGNVCVSTRLRCDGIVHCFDQLDERDCECNLATHFHCAGHTSCLENWKRCDGRVDCWDNSDEIDCSKTCSDGHVACSDGQCIKREQFCDGHPHCEDQSDEPNGCEIKR